MVFEAASCALGQEFVEEVYNVLVGRTYVWANEYGRSMGRNVLGSMQSVVQ